MKRYRSVMENARLVGQRNDLAAVAVQEENPMPVVGEDRHQLHWSVGFSACNVDDGRSQLALSRALVEMTLAGMKCTSVRHHSVAVDVELQSAADQNDSHQETLGSDLGAKAAKVTGKQTTGREEKASLRKKASAQLPSNHVMQQTSGQNPSWMCVPVTTAAHVDDSAAILDYTATLSADLEIDARNARRRVGTLKLRPLARDLVLIDRKTRKLLPGPRRWVTFGLLRQRNLLLAYEDQASMRDISADFYLADVTPPKKTRTKVIPLAKEEKHGTD